VSFESFSVWISVKRNEKDGRCKDENGRSPGVGLDLVHLRMSFPLRRTLTDRDSRPDLTSTRFRTLVWEGTVPIQVSLDDSELPQGSDRSVESFFVRATVCSCVLLFTRVCCPDPSASDSVPALAAPCGAAEPRRPCLRRKRRYGPERRVYVV
jgi:hypothetical protein